MTKTMHAALALAVAVAAVTPLAAGGDCCKRGKDGKTACAKAGAAKHECKEHASAEECAKAGCKHEGCSHEGKAAAKDAAKAAFACPMHPEVTSATKDRCPKCKMFLEPTTKQ